MRHQVIERIDPVTHRRVRQLTSHPGSHHHLYFTSNSFSEDNESIMFISNCDQNSNIFKISLLDGEAQQLTDNQDGYLKSYVYYDGNLFRGLGKASVSYNPGTNQVLYIVGREVRILDVDSLEEEVISVLPKDVMTGFTHLSSDGKYACVPYVTADAFDVGGGNQMQHIKNKIHSQKIESRVLLVNTGTRESDVLFSHVGWITHVQFHPNSYEEILFNHEGGSVDQRIWLYRSGGIEKVRDESMETEPIWICHEVWSQDGNDIIYHGTKGTSGNSAQGLRSFVGRYNTQANRYIEVFYPPEMTHYGHFTLGQEIGSLLTDGVIDNRLLHSVDVDWTEQSLSWTSLCHHDSSFCIQDVHPHPIFNHEDSQVLFSSDAHAAPGVANIYIVDVGEEPM